MGAIQQILASQKIAAGGGFPGGITPFTWLKASSLGLANNDPVSSWTDLSGNGHHFTQGTGANQPLYKTSVTGFAFPCVQGDGSNDVLTFTTATPSLTVIAVVWTGTLAAFKSWLGERSSAGNNFEPWLVGTNSGGNGALARTGTGTGTTVATATLGSPDLSSDAAFIWSVKRSFDGANTNVAQWIDGVAAGTGSDGNAMLTTDQQAIFAGYFAGNIVDHFAGAIAECLWYDTALSDGDRGLVEAALASEYGL